MALLPCIIVILAVLQPTRTASSVWPKPLNQTSSGRALYLDQRRFHFTSKAYHSRILQDAFCRYQEVLLSAPPTSTPATSMPNQLVRPEDGIRRVAVYVASNDQSLNLDTEESYVLSVSAPTTTIQAQTVYGALRGLETFVQLVDTVQLGSLQEQEEEELAGLPVELQQAVVLEEAEQWSSEEMQRAGGFMQPGCQSGRSKRRHKHRRLQRIEECIIHDTPRFQHRGLLIDTARHFLPVPVIKQHLEAMAMSKLNVLHWHLVDDQSFPLQSQELPLLSAEGAFRKDLVYTANDVRDVVEFARARGIRVIPELDTPGHTLSWGRGYPQLLTQCWSQGMPTGQLGPLNPARNETYAILWRLLREVGRLFPDAYMHIGGDEVSFKCWQSNPEVRQWAEERGWGEDFARVEEYFASQVLRLAAGAGKKQIVWQEMFDNGVELRQETVVQVWKWWPVDKAESQADQGGASQARKLLRQGWDSAERMHGAGGLSQQPAVTRGQQEQLGALPHLLAEEEEEQQPAWAAELQRITQAKHRAILSAPWYLNLGSYAGEDWAAYYAVEPLQGLQGASQQQAALVVGGEACMWGEYVDGSNAIANTWPRAAAVAERLWSDASVRDVLDARRRLTEHRCRMVARGVQASPLGPGYCPSEQAD